jgi:type II secretory pathway component PulL
MPRIVAFDLGTANVKATVWSVTGRKATFVERLLHPVPQDGTVEPRLEHQLLALEALIEENRELTASGTVIAASYGGRHVSVHRITLPFTDKRQVEKTLPFAVEEEVPFDLDDMVLGWRVMRQGEGTEALVALSEQAALQAALDGLTDLSVEPRRVAADKELLVRWALPEAGADAPGLGALGENDGDGDGDGITSAVAGSPVVAVLDVGHTRTVATVARDGELLGTRVMDIGGAAVTRAIQDGLRCSWANAERLKHGQAPEPDPDPLPPPETAEPTPEPADAADEEDTEPGGPLPEVPLTPWDQLPDPGIAHLPPAVRADVERVLTRLLSEIRSTLIGFEDSLGLEIDQVRLGGGGARLEGLVEAIQNDLGVPVLWAADRDGTPIPCEYLLADALAEDAAGRVKVSYVDLRTGPLRWRSGFNLLQAMVTYGGALVAFFTVALGVMYVWQSWSLASRIDEVQASIENTIETALPDANTRRTSQVMAKMRARIQEAEERAAALGDDGVPPTLDTIHGLSTHLPPPGDVQIDVTQMSITPRALNFEAEVQSYAAADQVEGALQATDRFETCTKSNEQQRRDRVSFNMTCDFGAIDDDGGEG